MSRGEEKRRLRTAVLARRDTLSSADRDRLSRAIVARFLGLPEYERARCVLFFVPFRSEVRTEEAIRSALRSGRTAVVPKSDVRNRRLVLSAVENLEKDLAPGAYGIPEPRPDRLRPVEAGAVELVMMPGSAFDSRGNRIGYGGGYYDAFVDTLRPGVPLVAVAFDLQIVPEVPTEEHDRPVDVIVTETRVFRRGTG
jgi:5-formyltetrahydrofolate cyclo-ligase